MRTKHFELHVVLDPADADLYVNGGLPVDLENGDRECANCGVTVSQTEKQFVPFAIVLSDEHHHDLCLSCSAPVTRPRS